MQVQTDDTVPAVQSYGLSINIPYVYITPIQLCYGLHCSNILIAFDNELTFSFTMSMKYCQREEN